MKNTMMKLRALVGMKSTLIKALQEDIKTANRRMQLMECRITEIERDNPWWKPLDDEMGRIEQKEREYGESGIGKTYYGPAFFEDTETSEESLAQVFDYTSEISESQSIDIPFKQHGRAIFHEDEEQS